MYDRLTPSKQTRACIRQSYFAFCAVAILAIVLVGSTAIYVAPPPPPSSSPRAAVPPALAAAATKRPTERARLRFGTLLACIAALLLYISSTAFVALLVAPRVRLWAAYGLLALLVPVAAPALLAFGGADPAGEVPAPPEHHMSA